MVVEFTIAEPRSGFIWTKALPKVRYGISSCLPLQGKIRYLADSRVSLECAAQANDQAVFRRVRRTAEELPVSFVVVRHQEDGESMVEDVDGRERRGIYREVSERPCFRCECVSVIVHGLTPELRGAKSVRLLFPLNDLLGKRQGE